MHDFWNQVILSNPIKKYLIVAVAILIAIILKRIFSRSIAGLLYRVVKRMTYGVDKDTFVNLLIAPLETFLIVLVTMVSIEKLRFPVELDFDVYEISSRKILHSIAITVFIMTFFWLLLRIIDFIALILKWNASRSIDVRDNQLITFLRDFLKVIIGIIGVLMILSFAFEFQVSSLWTGLGIAGAALALATKESIENLIASFIIFFDKPFTAGDFVKLNNISGTVEKIGLRSTRIRTEQKTYVTVPNKQMVDSVLDNLTLRTQRKAELRLQIGLLTPSLKLQQFIEGIKKILSQDNIESPSVFLNDIAGNALLINIDYFTSPISLAEFNKIKQLVNMEILVLMEGLDIQIAGASTDIHIVGPDH
jgi:MscS family membrane protein